jgi:hypothetical protein
MINAATPIQPNRGTRTVAAPRDTGGTASGSAGMILTPKTANLLAAFLVVWVSGFLTLAFCIAPEFRELIIGATIAAANSIYIWFFRRRTAEEPR